MDKVINYYSHFDEWGRLDRESLEFKVNWHYIKKHLPKFGDILDNGAGPGRYSIELAKLGYHVTLTDITPRLVDIAKEKAAEQKLNKQFRGFYVRDARRLDGIDSEQYDVSLMMGPLYHLQVEKDRISAVKELHRVTKENGVVFVAFRSRVGKIITSLLAPERWKPNDNMNSIYEFKDTGIFNHNEEGRFTGAYFFNIQDIKPFMESNGFETIELIGSTNIGSYLSEENWEYWRQRGKQEIDKLMELIYESANDPSILGMSSHLLYIGRKK